MADANNTPSISAKITTCITCDSKVPYRTTAKVYCDPCRAKAKKEKDRRAAEVQRRKRGIKPVKGTEIKCLDCKEFFERRNIKNVRCKPCQAEHILKKARAESTRKGRDRGCRPMGSKDNCKHCKVPIVVDVPGRLYCADCQELQRKRQLPHLIEWARKYRKEWTDRNYKGERRAEYQAMCRAYRARRKEKYGAAFTINERMSAGIRQSLKLGKEGWRWEKLVGYTVQELMEHLERQFTKGMSWDEFFAGNIHIDHIVPKVAFKFESYLDEEFKACWCLSNLRPMWASANIRKNDQRIYLV